MRDGSDSFSEKQFIVAAIEYLDTYRWRGIIPNYDAVDETVDEFLTQFHNEFYEVEFIRKPVETEDEAYEASGGGWNNYKPN